MHPLPLKKEKSCVPPPPTPTFKIHLPHKNFPSKEDSFTLPQRQVINVNSVLKLSLEFDYFQENKEDFVQ